MRGMLAALVSLPALALAASVEDDVQRYLAVMAGPPQQQAEQLEKLSGMGLSDPRLFDLIEQRLLAEAEAARNVREDRQRVAWYFRALGFSGDPKYHPTLSRFTEDRTYRNYALNAQRDIGDYSTWNRIIADRAGFDARLSDDSNRIMNMLRAPDMNLVRVGAKRVYFQGADEPVLEFLAGQLKARYMTSDPENADTVAWMVKALARSSAQQKYIPLLEEVRAGAPDRKVRNQAESQLRAIRR